MAFHWRSILPRDCTVAGLDVSAFMFGKLLTLAAWLRGGINPNPGQNLTLPIHREPSNSNTFSGIYTKQAIRSLYLYIMNTCFITSFIF